MKKSVQFIICVLLSFFLIQIHLSAQTSNTASRGVWLWGATLASTDAQTIVDKLSSNNVNEVYLLVKGTSGSATPDADITTFITKAHTKNIKVHLWYTVAQDLAYTTANPAARIYHCPNPAGGYNNSYVVTGERVNLLYPGYKDYVLNNIKHYIKDFDCDGIHLDYIRFGHMVYSFDRYSLAKAASLGVDTTRLLSFFNTAANYTLYTQNTGAAFIALYNNKDKDVFPWIEMRKNIVYDYIKAVRDTIKSLKPALKLSAALMPEAATDIKLADVYYAQNIALHSTVLDVISPMAYFKDYGMSTSWLKTVTQATKSNADPNCKVVTGFQAYGGVTSTQIDEQIKYALDGGSYGAIAFRYETITDTTSWKVIKSWFGKITDVRTTSQTVPNDFELSQNYPNPFNPTTAIDFKLAKSGMVSLKIYDAVGREVATLINKEMNAGTYKVDFNASAIPSGVYFYRINSGGNTLVKKMMVLK